MTSFRIPSSKYRHVFASASKRENSFEGFRFSKSSCDNPLCAVNPKFLAFCVDCGGGGAFQVIPVTKVGRLSMEYPKIDAHSREILDLQFNPFDDNMIASSSDDTTIKIWEIPEGEMVESIRDPLIELSYHQKKVHIIEWHPIAADVLLSCGGDNLVLVWNVLARQVMFQVEHPDAIFCASWSWDGKLLATSCKDLHIRLYDPRATDESQQLVRCSADKVFEGRKQVQIKCLKDNKLVATGFGRSSDRQYSLWDMNDLSAPLMTDELDQTSGVLFIVYDYDSNMVYLVGRGDTTIRFYEVKSNKIEYLNLHTFVEPQKGVAVMNKRGLNINACEVMRFYRVLPNKNIIEPCTWTVPRKSDMFQSDLFPDTLSNKPAIEADEWFSGQNVDPPLVPIQSLIAAAAPTGSSDGPKSRAGAIMDRINKKVKDDADKQFGSGERAKSRYEQMKEEAGLTRNGDTGGSTGSGSSVDVAKLMEEMKKLTLVVKAHEARIKQLEGLVNVDAANNNIATTQNGDGN